MYISEQIHETVKCLCFFVAVAKLVPVGYGIKKLQISCVVEDDKIGTDFLEEEITKNEDLIQSVDVAAFNKI
jgi:translation elongation factor EF-1beta